MMPCNNDNHIYVYTKGGIAALVLQLFHKVEKKVTKVTNEICECSKSVQVRTSVDKHENHILYVCTYVATYIVECYIT